MPQQKRTKPGLQRNNTQSKASKTTKALQEWKWLDQLTYVLLGILIILIYVIRSNFLDTPFERDEGEYFYLGQLILDGKIPYKDFFELKFPGMYYSYALIIYIFGATLRGAHLAFLIINMLTTVIMFFIGKKLFNNIPALVIAVSFALLSLSPQMSGFTTQSEHLMIFLLSGAFLMIIHSLAGSNRWYLLLFSGILMGYSLLIKQNSVFFIILGVAVILLHYCLTRPIGWKHMIKDVLLYSAGIILIIGIIIFIIYRQGALQEMWYYSVVLVRKFMTEIPFSDGLQELKTRFIQVIGHYHFFWILALAGLILVNFIKRSLSFKLSIWAAIILSIFSIFPGLHFYGHYWLQLTPILAILIGIPIFALTELFKNKYNPNYLKISLILFFLLFSVWHLNTLKEYYFKPGKTRLLKEVYQMNPFAESKVMADFINSDPGKGDQIAVLGSEPQMFFYTHCRSVSRHHYLSFLMTDSLEFPQNKAFQAEFIRDVETKKPKYLVFYKTPVSWLPQAKSIRDIEKWLSPYAYKNYSVVGLADMVSSEKTDYIWNQEAATYQPKGKYFIAVFKRKTALGD